MKKIIVTLVLILPIALKAQVGIGIPAPTAKLDIGGDLRIRTIPDLSASPNIRVLVADPTQGFVGYANVAPGSSVTTVSPITGDGTNGNPIRLIDGTNPEQILQWNNITNQWEIVDFPGWKLLGNAGTNPNNNFVGTTDNADLVFRTNNIEWVRYTTAGFVGIGTSTPLVKTQIQNGSFLIESPAVGPNTPPVASNLPTGAGTRFLWNHNKAAFRMGTVDNNDWDDVNQGLLSFAAGYNVKASGRFSFVVGNTSEATGDGTTALGKFVSTIHDGSFQIGDSPNNSAVPGCVLQSTRTDQFSARFFGGYRFLTAYDFQSSDENGVFIVPASLVPYGARTGFGTSAPLAKVHVMGDMIVSDLGGNGDRMVVTNNDGRLSTAPLPNYTAGTGIGISGGVISVDPFSGGDLTGNMPNPQVTKIQGKNVAMPGIIGNGSVLRWNQALNRWEPFTGFSGTVNVMGSGGNPCQMVYENGLLISTTCP